MQTMSNIKALSIKPQRRRQKRSLLPIVGDFASLPFGLSTENNVHKLREAVVELGEINKQIFHVLSESIMLINKSNENIEINRNVLNKIFNESHSSDGC